MKTPKDKTNQKSDHISQSGRTVKKLLSSSVSWHILAIWLNNLLLGQSQAIWLAKPKKINSHWLQFLINHIRQVWYLYSTVLSDYSPIYLNSDWRNNDKGSLKVARNIVAVREKPRELLPVLLIKRSTKDNATPNAM